MQSKKNLFIGIAAVIVVVAFFIFGGYNGLVTGQEGVKRAWADVQTQYQRRVDLIGNVVETAKGSAQFEQQTLQMVVEARSAWARAQSATSLNEQVTAANQAAPLINSALSRLLVTVEAYPQLKSTELFRDVVTELEGTENRVSVARRDYNQAVNTYNISVRAFPTTITAQLFGFKISELFTADRGAEKAPQVKFDFDTKK